MGTCSQERLWLVDPNDPSGRLPDVEVVRARGLHGLPGR